MKIALVVSGVLTTYSLLQTAQQLREATMRETELLGSMVGAFA